MSKELESLYRAAEDADNAFQAAVVRQFGRRDAGTYRYRSALHNAETKASAGFFHAAMDTFLAASRKEDRLHASDCAHWVNEPCDCVTGKPSA